MCKRILLSLILLFGLLAARDGAATEVINNLNYSLRCVPLGNTVSSTVFDLDATCAASFVGTGQAFNSLEPTPSDGSTQGNYLFDLGNANTSSTDDPTFTGTAGDPSSAYFSVDGGDYFELNLASGSMPALMKNVGKTTGGSDFWVGWVFYHQTAAASKGLAGNSGSSTLPGIFITINSSEQLAFAQRGDSATVTSTLTSPTLSNNTWYMVLMSYSTSGNVRFWVNTVTANATQAITFNATTTDPNASMRVFKSAGTNAGANMRLRWSGFGNTYLDNTEAEKIFSAIESRHNTDYTP